VVELSDKRLLIVDDNAALRRALRKLFEDRGWDVSEVSDADGAIAKALEFKPQLIVLDLSMPVTNGITAARMLRERVPDCRLILYSDFAHLLPLEAVLVSGFSAVVSKEHPIALLSEAQRCIQKAA
jgi:CheY-like chemotaxis protein